MDYRNYLKSFLQNGLRQGYGLITIACCALLCTSFGCSRAFYREEADFDAYSLVAENESRTQNILSRVDLTPDRKSRFYDPYDPDRPPMPQDDPASHELMVCVDGKSGYRHWEDNGFVPDVENPQWLDDLPWNALGKVHINLPTAVHLSRTHAREYQTQLEDLYLSSLAVSFQRFEFDTQYFGGNRMDYSHLGRDLGGSSTWDLGAFANFRKRFATGADLAVGFANSLVWQVAGPDNYTGVSLIDFTLIQPLLRAGSRARVLESLTSAERGLVADVRSMERFNNNFYVSIASGGSPGGGYYGRLQDAIQIENQEANIVSLRNSLAQLEQTQRAGRIDQYQVDLARQALYNAQSSLLSARARFEDASDSYKISLGLPPDLEVTYDDGLLDPFKLLDPDLVAIREDLQTLSIAIRALPANYTDAQAREALEHVRLVVSRADEHMLELVDDFQRLDDVYDERLSTLKEIGESSPLLSPEFDKQEFAPGAFETRVEELIKEYDSAKQLFTNSKAKLTELLESKEKFMGKESLTKLIDFTMDLDDKLLSISIVQAKARLESITLPQMALNSDQATEVASLYRRDWMNARASVVDSWRQIEVTANDLESNLDITVDGGIGTNAENPFRFRNTSGRLHLGVEFDAPLTRLVERNIYRQSLIDYQRSKRDYMAFEDGVSQSLRRTIRQINLNLVNFEFRRASVRIAIDQVDLMRMRLLEPPKPGAGQGAFGGNTVRDLLTALNSLLDAQNGFSQVWVNNEVLLMILDRDLGTMQLDENGIWVKPESYNYDELISCLPKHTIVDWDAENRVEELPNDGNFQLPDENTLPLPEELFPDLKGPQNEGNSTEKRSKQVDRSVVKGDLSEEQENEQKESEIQQVNYEPAPVTPHHKEEKSKEKKQANKSSPALKMVE